MKHIHESWPWTGTIRITVYNHETGETTVEEFSNLITNAGHNHLRSLLDGNITDGKIKWVAFGTSNTTPAATDTKLGAEVIRKQVTTQIENAGAGSLLTRVFLLPSDIAGTTVQEIGWFAGVNATSAQDSGTMIARVLYSHAHTSTESVQVDRTDQT
jgi:hypothetical protein